MHKLDFLFANKTVPVFEFKLNSFFRIEFDTDDNV
jgi:hypothetical protein